MMESCFLWLLILWGTSFWKFHWNSTSRSKDIKAFSVSVTYFMIFIDFLTFLTFACYREPSDATYDMMSAIFYFQHTLNRSLNNFIMLYRVNSPSRKNTTLKNGSFIRLNRYQAVAQKSFKKLENVTCILHVYSMCSYIYYRSGSSNRVVALRFLLLSIFLFFSLLLIWTK